MTAPSDRDPPSCAVSMFALLMLIPASLAKTWFMWDIYERSLVQVGAPSVSYGVAFAAVVLVALIAMPYQRGTQDINFDDALCKAVASLLIVCPATWGMARLALLWWS